MIKQIGLLCLLALISSIGYSQAVSEPTFYLETVESYYLPGEAPFQYVLADQVSLREAPSTEAKRILTLSIGTPLRVEARSENITRLMGIDAHWYRVQVKGKSGWIWGGLIAQQAFGSTTDPNVKFVAGYAKIERDTQIGQRTPYYQIRAFRGTEQIAKIEVASLTYSLGAARNLGPKGIAGVSEVLAVNMPCTGGCGCLTGDLIIFWDGKAFHRAMEVTGTPDGAYSEGAYLLFPVDMEGVPDEIIKITSGPGKEIPEADLGPALERIITKEYYRWDGKQLVPSGTPKKVERYRMPID